MHAHCPGHEHRDGILDEAIGTVLATVDMTVVLERTGHLLRKYFGATRLAIHLCAEDQPGLAETRLVDDPRAGGRELGTRFPMDGSLTGVAVRENRTVTLDNLDASRPRFREEGILARMGYGAVAVFPLVFGGTTFGALEIAHAREDGLLDSCLSAARQVSGLIAIALQNSQQVEEVRRLNALLRQENAHLKEEVRQARGKTRYIAESPVMRAVIDQVRTVADSDATVLIRGETGTGKEGLARMVHDWSPRFERPFVVVNLGALPDTLIESELFGYEKGAFTGADRRKTGRFEQADGGTLFLDEVGDAPPSVQVRLLRALQEREIQRVGGTRPFRVDVRIVAATNRPLERLKEEGRFRSDLYYRLNIFPVHLPPLRERKEDLRPLVRYFLALYAERMHRQPPRVPEAAWHVIEAHDWPGNVRELENYVQRALILTPGTDLVLPDRPGAWTGPPAGAAARPGVGRFDDEVARVLRAALDASGGRIYGPRGAAALLGLRPTTLQGKLRRYGIRPGK